LLGSGERSNKVGALLFERFAFAPPGVVGIGVWGFLLKPFAD
jgi:hypothetical protein